MERRGAARLGRSGGAFRFRGVLIRFRVFSLPVLGVLFRFRVFSLPVPGVPSSSRCPFRFRVSYSSSGVSPPFWFWRSLPVLGVPSGSGGPIPVPGVLPSGSGVPSGSGCPFWFRVFSLLVLGVLFRFWGSYSGSGGPFRLWGSLPVPGVLFRFRLFSLPVPGVLFQFCVSLLIPWVLFWFRGS